MARPLRVEFPGAWYHVANRGAGRQRIFRNDSHRQLLLDLIGELDGRFDVQVHAYCLMSNRYDLIVHTPGGGLAGAMRHLNGVYTQRYNRLLGRDGPLFRGRYQAIVFDPATCLLPVSRRIHRRPLATGMVPRLDRYRWSSYPSYVTRRRQPSWLYQVAVSEALRRQSPGQRYRQYVEREQPGSRMVRDFYRSGRPGFILGDSEFRTAILAQHGTDDPEVPLSATRPMPDDPQRILQTVAEAFDVDVPELQRSVRGRLNLPRLTAIWLCRHRCRLRLTELAQLFGMSSYGSASSLLHRIRTQMRPPFWRRVRAIEQQLDAVRHRP